MSWHDLYVSPSIFFGGFQKTFREANYVIVGVPFDVTSTFRSGSRFAPPAIREASINIETYSFRSKTDIEDLKLHDLGDLHITGEIDETLERLERVTKDLMDTGKTPIFIGGEHTITLGAMRAIGENVAIVSFDAHLDLRNEYMGRTISHTTFMRRIQEEIQPREILEIGTRAVCRNELDYAKKTKINFLTTQKIREKDLEIIIDNMKEIIDDCEKIYLTIDMDVLDPGFAPAVQNPEPDGLNLTILLDLLNGICDNRTIAIDLVEVTPHYDQGTTVIQAAKVLFEVLNKIEKTKRG